MDNVKPDQSRHQDSEIDLAGDGFEDGQSARGGGMGNDIAVAQGREGGETEVAISRTRPT